MNTYAIKLFFAMFLSFLISFYCIPILSIIAYRFDILDKPNDTAKKHQKSVPYLGGIGVYIGFISALAFVSPFQNSYFLFLVGVTLLLFIGLLDDLFPMWPHQKFMGQLIATFCFFKAGFYLKTNFFLSDYWQIPVSLLWIPTIINAYNLIDVMDGLAATVALISGGTFLCIAVCFRQYHVAFLIASFLGAVAAFLWYNKPPASIFLGDAGSLFLGGFLAAVPFLIHWGTYTPYGFLAPLGIMFVPLAEILWLVLVRTYQKIPFYRASPDHFAIYFLQQGWSRSSILFVTGMVAGFLGMCGLSLSLGIIGIQLFVILTLLFLFSWILSMICLKKKKKLELPG